MLREDKPPLAYGVWVAGCIVDRGLLVTTKLPHASFDGIRQVLQFLLTMFLCTFRGIGYGFV